MPAPLHPLPTPPLTKTLGARRVRQCTSAGCYAGLHWTFLVSMVSGQRHRSHRQSAQCSALNQKFTRFICIALGLGAIKAWHKSLAGRERNGAGAGEIKSSDRLCYLIANKHVKSSVSVHAIPPRSSERATDDDTPEPQQWPTVCHVCSDDIIIPAGATRERLFILSHDGTNTQSWIA